MMDSEWSQWVVFCETQYIALTSNVVTELANTMNYGRRDLI